LKCWFHSEDKGPWETDCASNAKDCLTIVKKTGFLYRTYNNLWSHNWCQTNVEDTVWARDATELRLAMSFR
ncbi:hypothetical protein PENTCL1PPCAC_4977, partial [Pristionchus entomophagus]